MYGPKRFWSEVTVTVFKTSRHSKLLFFVKKTKDKKRSKGRGYESFYVKKNYGTFGVEMRAYGQKLVKFCTHTHTHTQTHTHTHTHTHTAKLVVEIEAALSATVIILARLEPTSTKKLFNSSPMLCLLTMLIPLHSKWLASLDVFVFVLITAFSIFHVLLMFHFASVNTLE